MPNFAENAVKIPTNQPSSGASRYHLTHFCITMKHSFWYLADLMTIFITSTCSIQHKALIYFLFNMSKRWTNQPDFVNTKFADFT